MTETENTRMARELAEHMHEGAIAGFERDGYTAPTLMLFAKDGTGLIMHPGPMFPDDLPPAERFGMMVLGLARQFTVRHIVLCIEGWAAYAAEGEPEPERGELERRAQGGDAEVRTCVVTTVFDVTDWTASYSITSMLLEEPDNRWGRSANPGWPEGGMGETMRAAYERAVPRHDDEVTLDIIARAVVSTGMAEGVMVVDMDDSAISPFLNDEEPS